jgi:hypothetical protein
MPAVQNIRQVNRELQRLGLGHLKDPNLMAQMAFLVRDHAHFRGMLMHMPPADRHEAYKCLAPRLRFKALPLEDYEIQSKQEAEKRQLPEYDPKTLEAREWGSRNVETPEYKAEPRSVLTETAEKAIARDLREAGAKYQLELVCSICTFEQKIRVKRKSSAYKIAKQDGWTFTEQGKKALCFACSKKRLQ